jgi:phosphomannomutase
MPIKLSISGIRGKYHELTPNIVVKFVQAFSTYINGGKVILGADARPSGKFISEAVTAGLRSTGSDVFDYGIIPSPIVQWIIKNYKYHGGISITAGHNPFEWNSLVFFNNEGSYLNHLEGEEFFNLYHSGNIRYKNFNKLGKYQRTEAYVDNYFKALRIKKGRGREMKFVVDCSNGFDCSFINRLSGSINTKLIPIFCRAQEQLQKDPEPNLKNAGFLSTVVKETGSDGGFLLNSDGSRVLIVDETGKPLSEEMTLPLFATIVLEEERGDIVTNYSTSQLIDSVAKKYGVKVFRTDVGQPYVVQMVKEIKAKIGGEGSGSVVYSPFSLGFDSFVFIKKIVNYLREHNLNISALAQGLDPPEIYKETIFLPPHKIYNFLEKIGDLYSHKTKLKDGFYISKRNAWLCIRASATVSMIRIIGEGKGVAGEIARVKEEIE